MRAAEQRIIEMRDEGKTWDEIARIFNVSIERIKQIHVKATNPCERHRGWMLNPYCDDCRDHMDQAEAQT